MKNYLIPAVIALVVAGGAWMVLPHSVQQTIQQLGAQATNVVEGTCFIDPAAGGHLCTYTRPLTQATSTVCAIQSPAATSTLVLSHSFLNLQQGTSTATQITFAKSSMAFSTTTNSTLISYNTLASALKATIMATTSYNGGVSAPTTATAGTDTVLTFAPNTWFVVGIAGNGVGAGTANQFNLTGLCSAGFAY